MAKQLFVTDSYLKECEAAVLEVDEDKVFLDQTVFYPTGGGQEHDTGVLVQGEHTFEVYRVKRESGRIAHYVKDAGKLEKGPYMPESTGNGDTG